jgi:hypothetical protein
MARKYVVETAAGGTTDMHGKATLIYFFKMREVGCKPDRITGKIKPIYKNML